ncbi:hypothetical protein SAMIE_1031440 [Sphingobium amiense]|uniref:Uncharacterized protein n=1 Tax=Sphingobium amiense TaxID=135719 RepID=A0A494W4V8_9SPHN|nr:hypothetical protein [Sphingobium amiense]BBD99643.1 hypothetical protein SAMIE_1031440 [Sphingobium amiense]
MRDLQLSCLIDGCSYSAKQLDGVQYRRHVHALHTLMRLGAVVNRRGQPLSHDAIDRLLPEDAREVSIATRQAYGPDGLKELYRDQLLESDKMWRAANDAAADAPLLLAQTDITVVGVSLEDLSKVVGLNAIHHVYAALHPDHDFAIGDETCLEHMETFGHFGGPTWLFAHPDKSISVPVERDEEYPMLMAGHTTLASDGTPMNLYAYHQFKPLENGFAIKQCAAFPPNTPLPIVDGHKLHLAIEIWEAAKLAAKN